MKKDYTVLVNSCDCYDDLWTPFFTLFKKHFGSCDKRIILNTETKNFSFPGLNIETFSLFKDNPDATWSERFLAHLKLLDTEFVLILLDDFFFEAPVDTARLEECFNLMAVNRRIACFNFLPTLWENLESDICPEDFELRPKKCEYKVNVQASLWRVDVLIKLLRPHESVWEFENFGSVRAHRMNDLFFVAKPFRPTVFTYDWGHGGAVHHGKWTYPVKAVLDAAGIAVDYSKRGWDEGSDKPYELTISPNQVYSPRLTSAVKTLIKSPRLFLKKIKERLSYLSSNRKSLH